MYTDMNDDELQAWLLGEAVITDNINASDAEWDAASTFRDAIRDHVYASQYQRESFNAEDLCTWE